MAPFAYKMLIGGKMVKGEKTFDVINPSTEEVVAKAPTCTESQLDDAVEAARKAFPSWAAMQPADRQGLLKKAAQKIEESMDSLVELLVKEQGKPVSLAQEEFAGVVATLNHMGDEQFEWEKVLLDDDKETIYQRRMPIGVVGGITPWNFPPLMAVWKLAEALSTGNCCIIKPSSYTPLTTLAMGEILADVFPAGVLNMLSGSEIGKLMVSHKGIDKISFTGSTAAGKAIQSSASDTLKRLTLELGGNDPAVVLEDADPNAAAEGLFKGAMSNSGQVCVAIKRAFVHEKIFDQVVQRLVQLANDAKVGDGFAEGVEFGPMNNKMQFDQVQEIVEESKKQGAKVLAGGKAIEGKGYFFQPTIMSEVCEGTRIVDEEQFGPILPVMKWSDIEDVIKRANRTEYGLGASVWSKNLDRAKEVADRLYTGTVWVNSHADLSPQVPFGGVKMSGVGKQLGHFTIEGYTEAKIIRVTKSQ